MSKHPTSKPFFPLGSSYHSSQSERIRFNDDFIVGLYVPVNGAAGIWGPSSIACAQLAQTEINNEGGLGGRRARLRIVDASDEAEDIGEVTRDLLGCGAINAIVGMHTSQVRQRILQEFSNQVPYIYTPLYEGGEFTPGVYALGETPEQQLRPALEYIIGQFQAKRWVFLGNDYVWPRVSHGFAAEYLKPLYANLLADYYVPLGTRDFADVLAEIARLEPDGILLSLVGQDAIDFNRAFGESGLSKSVLRLSTAIEENELLAIGAGNTHRLFAASGYFAGIDSRANQCFKERYYTQFGQRAPTLNALGQSTYEGVQFLAALVEAATQQQVSYGEPIVGPLKFKSVRGIEYIGNGRCKHLTYLAEAQGHLFKKPLALPANPA